MFSGVSSSSIKSYYILFLLRVKVLFFLFFFWIQNYSEWWCFTISGETFSWGEPHKWQLFPRDIFPSPWYHLFRMQGLALRLHSGWNNVFLKGWGWWGMLWVNMPGVPAWREGGWFIISILVKGYCPRPENTLTQIYNHSSITLIWSRLWLHTLNVLKDIKEDT